MGFLWKEHALLFCLFVFCFEKERETRKRMKGAWMVWSCIRLTRLTLLRGDSFGPTVLSLTKSNRQLALTNVCCVWLVIIIQSVICIDPALCLQAVIKTVQLDSVALTFALLVHLPDMASRWTHDIAEYLHQLFSRSLRTKRNTFDSSTSKLHDDVLHRSKWRWKPQPQQQQHHHQQQQEQERTRRRRRRRRRTTTTTCVENLVNIQCKVWQPMQSTEVSEKVNL